MIAEDEDYQDDFEQYSDDYIDLGVQKPQGMIPQLPLVQQNEREQCQQQAYKMFNRPSYQRDQSNVSTNDSILDLGYKPPLSLKSTKKQQATVKVAQTSSQQHISFQKERVATTTDNRRSSVGHQSSQKRMKQYEPSPYFNKNRVQSSVKKNNTVHKQLLQQNLLIVDQPHVSAQCWAIFNGKTGEFIQGRNERTQREVASITKIMTCWVTLQLVKKFKLAMDDVYFEVSYQAASVGGTSANLCPGDQLSVRDLLYGLMLPSGNDAALTLAENFADFYAEYEDELTGEDLLALRELRMNRRPTQLDFFISQMNLWARNFGMAATNYANPHGLVNDKNKSTAYDIGLLAYQVMKDARFAKIVGTKIHFSEIVDEDGFSKEIFWENTNKMLYRGFSGVKTGITTKAGPCVVEYYKDERDCFIFVILNSKTQDERWVDAMKMLQWAKQRQV